MDRNGVWTKDAKMNHIFHALVAFVLFELVIERVQCKWVGWWRCRNSVVIHICCWCCCSCFWPACSSNCAGLTNPNGHGIECALLSTQRGIKPAQATDHRTYLDFYRSDALLVLRCLLLQYQFPDKWDKVQTLGSHDEERRGTQYYA